VVYKAPGLDTFDIDIIEELIPVKCYRVEAIEQNGITTSLSNVVCYINEGKIYYPNALVINGVNNTFNFYGPGLELEKSSIRLYNRWGEEIYKTSNLMNGWNGIDNNGEFVNTGVYVFIADIVQGKEIITIKGNISVIQ
jgi:gliding motility-associated-like protein